MSSVRVAILPPGSIAEQELTYVVIGARQEGEWVFVRHHERTTWEMPAGHIEPGETADQAAVRELYEETGTVRSDLEHLCDYEVEVARTEYGRFYMAEIHERSGILEHEIAEIMLTGELPGRLTYPEVQILLYERARQHLGMGR